MRIGVRMNAAASLVSVRSFSSDEGTRLGPKAFWPKKRELNFRCEMKRIALVLALAGSGVLATSVAPSPAHARETYEAKMEASEAASQAAFDMFEAFGFKRLKPGQYLWRDVPESVGRERVVISLTDQLVFLYRGNSLMAVATISTGRDEKPSPTGIFSVLDKKPFYR